MDFVILSNSIIGAINSVMGFAQGIVNEIQSAMKFIVSLAYFGQIIMMVVIIGRCIFAAFRFIIEFFIWIFDFLKWLILPWPNNLMNPRRDDVNKKAGFICWLIRYIIVIAYKITSLPKCFLWYFLDTAGWVIYLPFRFVFWLIDFMLNIGMQKMEKDIWYFLDEIDYFLHGKPGSNYFMFHYDPNPPPRLDAEGNDLDAMNFGFHIIHFPNSVMEQCYSLSPYSLVRLAKFPIDAFEAFLSCAMNPF
jgi:hypothetical protein